ncbi:MAG: superoxide dismutase [Phycisphaerales bacterium]
MTLKLPDLPYPKDALEPHFDAVTMEIHHDRHHKGYVDKANAALEGTPLADLECPFDVCSRLNELPKDKQTAVRNNAGGVANHWLFWEILAPAGKGGGGTPSGELASMIDASFGSFDAFKEQFANAAATRFGSGWAWLCLNDNGKLEICSTANQDNPVMKNTIGEAAGCGGRPILGLDVWEHAYYLKYQNKRPEYISNFWSVVNWSKVAEFAQSAHAQATA